MNSDGFLKGRVLRPVYDRFVRPLLPRKIALYDGVAIRDAGLFDQQDTHQVEQSQVAALREYVRTDDDVVIVGGGRGVTAVWAAWRGANVTVFEGAEESVEDVLEVAQLNEVNDNISVRQALVGPGIDVWGDASGAEQVAPSELPDCDVLELDCEGAELDILDAMEIRPRVLLVEAHGIFGAPPEEVRERLKEMGYEVIADEEHRPEKDVRVLAAIQSE